MDDRSSLVTVAAVLYFATGLGYSLGSFPFHMHMIRTQTFPELLGIRLYDGGFIDRLGGIDAVITLGLLVSVFPIALAIAILQYRLFDIDLIINRALVYGALTAIVVGIYVLIVGYAGALLQVRSTAGLSLIAAGVVALLVHPLRERLQRAVNRWMYGERDDPYTVLARLSRRLEAVLAPDAVLPAIVETVAQTLKLPHAAVNLRRGDQVETVAAFGLPRGEPVALPLAHQGQAIGEVLLSPRAPGEPFSPTEQRLLADIANQIGVAAHAVLLTEDLQRSRQRLVTAQEEERRRLRRDLHDGLGPALAAIALKLEAARNMLGEHPAAVDALLAQLKRETHDAIADIRRLVYDLRPPALDELGLAGAIREHAARAQGNGLSVAVEIPNLLPPLPAAVEVAAYRIVQEALTNVIRHARAHVCRVRLDIAAGLVLEVTDDGVGVPERVRVGVGLASIRERASELGGRATIERLGLGRNARARPAPTGAAAMTAPIRVLIADDHRLFREGVRALLQSRPEVEVVGEAATGDEVLAEVARLRPDVVLMDIQMPGLNGIEATRRVLAAHPQTGILVLTMYEDDDSVFAAMRAGARGYVLKGADQMELLRAIQAVASGEALFSPDIAKRLVAFFAAGSGAHAAPFPELTEREREVLDLIAQGLGNAEIARRLVISGKTVRNHVSNIFSKLQVADRAQAIVRAREAGLGQSDRK